ncbi:MAG TPA: Pvc16 family protein [Pyrinomonadaceae bacterium]
MTAAVRQILLNSFHMFGGATVKTDRPESLKAGSFVGANLYLYHVGPNVAYRNSDLATRTSNGELVQRPQVALDLNYLLTFYGDDDTFEPQRLLGRAVSALNAQPVLKRPLIQEAIKMARDKGDHLKHSDLADQIESVRITPLYLNLDETSKLWTVFFQTAHTLSIFYQGSVVLIEADAVPQAHLPVRVARLFASPTLQPLIEKITPQQGANEPVVAGTTLVISGQRLNGRTLHVYVDEVEVPLNNMNAGGTSFNVTIPKKLLKAGTKSLSVTCEMMIGAPPVPTLIESNLLTFVLRPSITRISALLDEAETDESNVRLLQVQTDSVIGATQRVVLLLNEIAPRSPVSFTLPPSYTFHVGSRVHDSDKLIIPISGIVPGVYLVRLQVDGAESPLVVDSDPASPNYNYYIAPQVTIL